MRQVVVASAWVAAAIAVFACGSSNGSLFTDGSKIDGGASSGGTFPVGEAGADTGNSSGGGGGTDGVLEAIIRDFKKYDVATPGSNQDFENVPAKNDPPVGKTAPYFGNWTEATAKWFPGAEYQVDLVLDTLGADGTPDYNTAVSYEGTVGRSATTHGKTFFDQWYHDVPGINVARKIPLQLTRNADGVFSYDSAVSGVPESPTVAKKGFWPIDDGTASSTTADGFGNQGNFHNYHFTVELHTKFTYRGNETFKFSGDDDVFVYINKKLVLNIGGIHEALSRTVTLPEIATEVGLVVGEEYPLDFFQAERHITQSNLRIDTTIELSSVVR